MSFKSDGLGLVSDHTKLNAQLDAVFKSLTKAQAALRGTAKSGSRADAATRIKDSLVDLKKFRTSFRDVRARGKRLERSVENLLNLVK